MFIVKSSLFEGIILIVIIWNSVMLALDDPTTNVEPKFQSQMEDVFLIFYTIEMSLKIFAYVMSI